MTKFRSANLLVAFLLIGFVPPTWAASTKSEVLALKEEVEALKTGQEQMQEDLAEIKKLLEAGARPAPTAPTPPVFEPRDVSIAGAPVKGKADAKLTLIEYSDYQCPFCSRHAKQTMPQLMENYIDTGKLKFVMREFPIPSLHPRAPAASEAALCAGDQGKYWEMHDILFDNQRSMSDEDLLSYAEKIELNVDQFTTCVDSDKFLAQVESNVKEGSEMGVRGTPSFVLGYTSEKDPDVVKVVRFIRGARPYDSFADDIEELLNSGPEEDPAP